MSKENSNNYYVSPGSLFCGELSRATGSSSGVVSATVTLTTYDALRHILALDSGNASTGHSYMSLEGLIRPISLYGQGGLPGVSNFDPYNGSGYISGPSYTMPPLTTASGSIGPGIGGSGVNQLEINAAYINPLMNPGDACHGVQSGHDFVLLNRETDNHLCIQHSAYTGGSPDYTVDYQLLALRGPLMLTGWGHDTDGKPVPNKNDASGVLPSGALTDKFLDNWLQRSDKWATGPVDLRFDRRRGVWVSPQPPSLVIGKLTAPLAHTGTASARLIYGKTIYDAAGSGHNAGNTDKAPVFDVRGRIHRYFPSGTEFVANYDTNDKQYYIITTSKPLFLLTNCSDGGDQIWSDLHELADHVDSTGGDGSGIDDIVSVEVATGDDPYAPLQRKCYQITLPEPQPTGCYSITCIEPIEYFDDCEKCNPWWIIERCPTGTVPSGKYKTNQDLSDYDERVIKIDLEPTGCFYVSRQAPSGENGDLEPPSSGVPTTGTFSVIDDYEDCDICAGCYTLEKCSLQDGTHPDIHITDNLYELTGEVDGDAVVAGEWYVKVSGVCYEVVDYNTPCTGVLIGLTEDHIYTACSGCVSLYRWTQNCSPDECSDEPTDINEEPDLEVDDIVTSGDYATSVGKYRKSSGLVYQVQFDPVATTGDEDFRANVESTGPYDTCEEALLVPIDGDITPLRKVTIGAGNVPQWHINKFIFAAGVLTGLCPTIVKASGSVC